MRTIPKIGAGRQAELGAEWDLTHRPRRNRGTEAWRRLAQESRLSPSQLIWPLFVVEGESQCQKIEALPGIFRWSVELLVEQAAEAERLGIPGVALFPRLDDSAKDGLAREAINKDGLIPRAVRALKKAFPQLLVITDVAMDPYSSDGHDGVLRDGIIHNDESLEILAKMALVQAQAGADLVAPSDMMDGRVAYIRRALDQAGFTQVGILAYSAKYASSFYGPFREALGSAPKWGDKKTYQMDPANAREAEREVLLDLSEGADIVMVKPAISYLDIIYRTKQISQVPVAAYQVSGEYAMAMAAGERGWLSSEAILREMLLSIHRAGADIIISYYARQMAEWLNQSSANGGRQR